METKAKKSRLPILAGILLGFNILTLGTLWYLYINDPQPESRAEMRRKNIQDFMRNKMNFTEGQAKQLNILRDEHFKSKAMIFDSVRQLKRRLVDEIMKDVTDSLAIQRITNTIAVLQAENEKSFTLHFIQVKEICTPEQRKNLRQFLLEMAESPGKHGMIGHPPPNGGPPIP